MRYGDFKKLVAETVIARLTPIQERYREVSAEPAYLDGILKRGREHVLPLAEDTLRKARSAMGLGIGS